MAFLPVLQSRSFFLFIGPGNFFLSNIAKAKKMMLKIKQFWFDKVKQVFFGLATLVLTFNLELRFLEVNWFL